MRLTQTATVCVVPSDGTVRVSAREIEGGVR